MIGGLHGEARHHFCGWCMTWMFTRMRNAAEPDKAAVVFTRLSLGWAITGVDLPPEALAATS